MHNQHGICIDTIGFAMDAIRQHLEAIKSGDQVEIEGTARYLERVHKLGTKVFKQLEGN